jgi:hypothetical protein
LPNARLVVFERSGHHALVEEHGLFMRTVRAFFADRPLPMPLHDGPGEAGAPAPLTALAAPPG